MFYASPVLLRMLAAADIAPERLNHAVGLRVRRRRSAMRWCDHFPRLLKKATGIEVVWLRRRNRHLLLELAVEGIRYVERGRRDVEFTCPGTLPATQQAAAIGRRLDEVFDLRGRGGIFAPAVIHAPADAWEGVVSFAIEPSWTMFGGEGSTT